MIDDHPHIETQERSNQTRHDIRILITAYKNWNSLKAKEKKTKLFCKLGATVPFYPFYIGVSKGDKQLVIRSEGPVGGIGDEELRDKTQCLKNKRILKSVLTLMVTSE